jgi:hypothetical protein
MKIKTVRWVLCASVVLQSRAAPSANAVGSAQRPATRASVPGVDANRARVTSVSPANGAKDIGLEQDLRIRFDRAMNPYYAKLEWVSGGFHLNGRIQVSADRREFTIPVLLTPGEEQSLVLNRDEQREMFKRMGQEPPPVPRSGFLDAKSVPANEFRWSFTTRAPVVQPGAERPKVVSASPPSDSSTPVLTFVCITFDQPMRPPDQTFPYLQKTGLGMGPPNLIPSFDYDAATHRFSFPAVLRPDDDTRLTLGGFYSAAGVAANPVVLHYESGTESLDPHYVARANAAAKDPKLLRLLRSMKQVRLGLRSGVETVQSLDLSTSKTAFKFLNASTTVFKWQGANQVYADITASMSMVGAFILGDDGKDCWLYAIDAKDKKRLDRTPDAVTEKDILVLDPFELTRRSVSEALSDERLVLSSKATLEGHPCYRVERWQVTQNYFVYAVKTQWWIDAKSFLPRQIVQYRSGGCQIVRFDCHDLNQHLPESAFEPPPTASKGTYALFFKKAPQPDEQRFLRISDGSDGRMSGRIGWHGPNGTTDSGMN